MSEDQTGFITKEHADTNFNGYSGRFWIALILAIGWVITTILVMVGTIKLDGNTAIAVYTGFTGGAITIITMYMGQNKSTQTPNEKI